MTVVPIKRLSIADFQRKAVRRLRVDSTDAEKRLWRRLRQLPIAGSHFRRQVPIGPYIADFACMASRLIVEVDGSQRGSEVGVARDEARSRWLAESGYRVIRFWNSDIATDLEGVVAAIYSAVYGSTDSEPVRMKHQRRCKSPEQATPPRRASRADPPPPGEGKKMCGSP